jgi:type IV pilus assembly protein PilB
MLRELGFTDKELDELKFYRVQYDYKCRTCNGVGYKGRRAICETLYFTRGIRHLIVEAGDAIDEDAIREQGIKDGMLTLRDSARELVKMGLTSIEEMIRVTSTDG